MSVGVVLVDDHLLLRLLFGDEPPDLRPDGATMFTTGCGTTASAERSEIRP